MPPRLARLLAAIVAVALVAGAFAVRSALTDDEPASSSSSTDPGGEPDASFSVICDADLGEAACDALAAAPGVDEVVVVHTSEVRAAGPNDDLADHDAWLTVDPMPGVVDAGRAIDGSPPFTTGDVVNVASSSLAVLTFPDTQLECAEPMTWSCLIVRVRPPVAVPAAGTSVGVVALAAGAAALQGTTDFGINQFRDHAATAGLLDLFPRDGGAATTARQTLAMLDPGNASGAITIAGLGAVRADTVRGQGRGLHVVPIAPAVTVGVVLVGLGDDGAAAVAALEGVATGQTVRDALAEAGWDGEPAQSSGLPEADVINALREDVG